MSLPERPGLLHALPVCDLFVVLWLMFLLSSALVRQSGVAVELPPSQFQLDRFQETHVVTLGPGVEGPMIHFGRDVVTMDELLVRLERLRVGGQQLKSMVLLQTDAETPAGFERAVAEAILGMGFRLALVGDNRQQVPAAEREQPPAPGR